MDQLMNFFKHLLYEVTPRTVTYDGSGKEIPNSSSQISSAERRPATVIPQQQVLGAQTQETPTPTPSVSPSVDQLAKIIQSGLEKYGSPLASNAIDFAQAGAQLPDPYLPVKVALRETSGGKNITRGAHNIFNTNANIGGVNYPDVGTAINGGQGHKGFIGNLLHSGYYNDYLKSGKLQDFLQHYSPPNDGNGTIQDQVGQYNQLQNYFQPQS